MRASIVPRPRLVSRLHEGLTNPLTVVSAPAGYGKTTLLGEWRANSGRDFPAAWLALDADDNNLPGFLAYLVNALESAGTGLAGKTLSQMQSSARPAPEAILASLVDDLAGYPHNLVLILDDYHVIEAPQVHDALKFLLQHLPPQVHLVLLTRADPPLPLARLRASGQMTEIRAADLRFTSAETAAFLNEVMGLNLSAADVAALEARTEGWIAGLQLAALSMQGRGDMANFINAFTGSHRYIVDYLVEEVLNRQPAHIRNFLLKTSILERMSASLCDALIENGQPGDSQAILEYLERANIFLNPLDDERRWYRYHHLFADVLRTRLQHSQAGELAVLYRRAIAWYEQNDLIDQAVQHALALKDYESAAQLLHRHWLHLLQQGFTRESLLVWLDALPPELVAANPRLCMARAWMLLPVGRKNEALEAVACVEKVLRASTDDPEYASLSSEALIIHAFDAILQGEYARALDLCQRAREIVPESAIFVRGALANTFSVIQMETGNYIEAIESARLAVEMTRAAGIASGQVGAVSNLASCYITLGQLRQAMDTCQQALQEAEALGQARSPYYGFLYRYISAIYYEWDDLAQAERYLNIASQMAENSRLPLEVIGSRFHLLQLHYARGKVSAARDLFESLTPHFDANPGLPAMPNLASYRVRWGALLGHPDVARAWLSNVSLAVPEKMTSKHAAIYLNAARAMLALGQRDEALDFLQKIEVASKHIVYWRLEGLILQSVTWHKKGEKSYALACLEKALELGEQGGFARMFLDEAPEMIDLLKQAITRGIRLSYTTRLLDSASMKVIRPAAVPALPGLLEPLSDRELEVLRLIARGRLNKEIADELVIAIGTVKRHTANIFRKLDVINRTQAVARSRELGLL